MVKEQLSITTCVKLGSNILEGTRKNQVHISDLLFYSPCKRTKEDGTACHLKWNVIRGIYASIVLLQPSERKKCASCLWSLRFLSLCWKKNTRESRSPSPILITNGREIDIIIMNNNCVPGPSWPFYLFYSINGFPPTKECSSYLSCAFSYLTQHIFSFERSFQRTELGFKWKARNTETWQSFGLDNRWKSSQIMYCDDIC
jgi:hypothetical protein